MSEDQDGYDQDGYDQAVMIYTLFARMALYGSIQALGQGH